MAPPVAVWGTAPSLASDPPRIKGTLRDTQLSHKCPLS